MIFLSLWCMYRIAFTNSIPHCLTGWLSVTIFHSTRHLHFKTMFPQPRNPCYCSAFLINTPASHFIRRVHVAWRYPYHQCPCCTTSFLPRFHDHGATTTCETQSTATLINLYHSMTHFMSTINLLILDMTWVKLWYPMLEFPNWKIGQLVQ